MLYEGLQSPMFHVGKKDSGQTRPQAGIDGKGAKDALKLSTQAYAEEKVEL